jgi:hypothetical protein
LVPLKKHLLFELLFLLSLFLEADLLLIALLHMHYVLRLLLSFFNLLPSLFQMVERSSPQLEIIDSHH